MAKHTWSFFRVGGFDQVQLRSGDDIAHLAELDPKLWVATACPAKDIELDKHTLSLLDTDGDGRIRVPEVLAAAKWLCSVLTDPDELFEGNETLPLSSIDDTSDEGTKLRASARQILKNLGRADAKEIAPADTRDTAAIFAQTVFNGDGVVPPESAEEDEATAQVIRDVITCFGAEKDASGKDGTSQAKVDTFFTQVKEYADWWRSGESDASVFVLGEQTPAAFDAYSAVRDKVRDFFTRCALASMDERAEGALNPTEADLTALSPKSLSEGSEALAGLPIARVGAKRELPLDGGVNPAFRAAIATFRAACVEPLLGARAALTAEDWRAIEDKLAAHAAWRGTKPAGDVDTLGTPRLLELAGSEAKAKIDALVLKDLALEAEAKAIESVDRLVHYYRDFGRLLRNFVSFEDFYAHKEDKATFQAGVLYLDGRSFDLCMRVTDAAKHASLAGLSMACLVYCDCARGAEKMSIVAAITNGDSDFLMVGRNGVFYDREGRDWDATVTKVVEQPISVRQAFWSPYKKAARFVSAQVERFAGERSAASDQMLESAGEIPSTAGQPAVPSGTPPAAAAAAAPAASPPAAPAFDVAKFAGVFAAIGLALGAIGTAVAAVVTGFLGLELWQMPLAVGGALLAVSGPSMLLAALKLRQRNLGPLLDASGWAINTRARINIPFGATLTSLAALPSGSSRSLTDPYADKRSPWKTVVITTMIVSGGLYLARHELAAWLQPHVADVPVVREWVDALVIERAEEEAAEAAEEAAAAEAEGAAE